MGEQNAGVEVDPASLEYEEDCFYASVSKSETPSFDVVAEEDDCLFVIVEEEFDEPASLEVDLPESCQVEAEFYDLKTGRNKWVRGVRVKFEDLSKPYLARITTHKNYSRFLHLVRGGGRSHDCCFVTHLAVR